MQRENMLRVSRYFPRWLKSIVSRSIRLFVYRNYDSSEYWRKRAAEPDQAAVLWKNQDYNRCYREDQRRIVSEYILPLPSGSKVLDIGCGIGVVAKMMLEINPGLEVDAVDFEEMVAVAKRVNADERIQYIASAAEDYHPGEKIYDLVVSSGCYSAIRKIGSLELALDNAANMVVDGGGILMIDPFHRWSYLARAKYGSGDVVRRMKANGFHLVKKSGVLFWPYRELLANSHLRGEELRAKYQTGERLLSVFGRHFWADYKILVFKK